MSSSPKSSSSVLKYRIPVCDSTSAICRSRRFDVRSPRGSRSRGLGESRVSGLVETICSGGSRRGFRSRRGGSSGAADVFSTTLVLRERRTGFASRVAFSSGTPDPKSSSTTGSGISTSSSATFRRDRVAGRLVVLRGVARRRGVRWLVPSESELLVGINGNLTEPFKGGEVADEHSSQTSINGLFRIHSDSLRRMFTALESRAECLMPAA